MTNQINGKKLKQYRNDMNISLQDLANRIGVTKQCLSQVELGTLNLSKEKLDDLLNVLNNYTLEGFTVKRIKKLTLKDLI